MRITPHIQIPDGEIRLEFVRAGGPGGQNVNKVSSAVQLRFDVLNSPSLPAELKQRLVQLAGSRMTAQGVLVIDARRHRTQLANRQDALERLAKLLGQAAVRPKHRRATRPTAASRLRRLQSKKRRSRDKLLRRHGQQQ